MYMGSMGGRVVKPHASHLCGGNRYIRSKVNSFQVDSLHLKSIRSIHQVDSFHMYLNTKIAKKNVAYKNVIFKKSTEKITESF